MRYFEFSVDVVSKILEELESAQKFIKIAIFQIHSDKLFDLLEKKLQQDIKIDIITLPYDSINEQKRDEVTKRFKKIAKLGANLHFCRWNVGNPEKTSMASGKWYSYHGKFIVTDRSAIIMSANFTIANELDAFLIIRDEPLAIENFNRKFEEMLDLFITEKNGFQGEIRNRILNTGIMEIENVLEQPGTIQSDVNIDNWVKHYPVDLCPDELNLKEGLFISPFDIKGRSIYKRIINEAEKYIYISAESFTDIEFGFFLNEIAIGKNISITIICGSTSADFGDRIQKLYRSLIAAEINLYTTENDLHAKLIITDKHLLISSINLNKMNLGFNKTKKYWRQNTETIYITSDKAIIDDAKMNFGNQLSNCISMEKKLAVKLTNETSTICNKIFKFRVSKEYKQLFVEFILDKEIQIKRDTYKFAKITKKLMTHYRISIADIRIFVMASILLHLSERKYSITEIMSKLKYYQESTEIDVILIELRESEFIELERNYYKINIESLF